MKYVIDSSVILELFLGNSDEMSHKIFTFLDANKSEITSHLLLYIEIYNVVNKRIKDPQQRKVIQDQILQLNLQLIDVPLLTITHTASEIAQRFGVTMYDASYHALALQTNQIFVTFDRKYVDKARSLGGAKLFTELLKK